MDEAELLDLLDRIEDWDREAIREALSLGGRGWTVGVGGPPGVGKSTIIDALGPVLSRGSRVAVLAVDPTSPRSGGALLGDRIRMRRLESSGGLIRSISSRGSRPRLWVVAYASLKAISSAGYDWIFVESVGGGQLDYEIAYFTKTFIYVTIPGLGDEIQVMKAGSVELADVVVVNKRDILYTSALADLYRRYAGEREGWVPRVLETSAFRREDMEELAGAIREHRAHLERNPSAAGKKRLTAISILAMGVLGSALDSWAEGARTPGKSDLELLEEALSAVGIHFNSLFA